MLQTSLLLMKSLSKTETPIFLSVVCSLFPKAIFLTFIVLLGETTKSENRGGATRVETFWWRYMSCYLINYTGRVISISNLVYENNR